MDPNDGDSSRRKGKNAVADTEAPADPQPIRFALPARAAPMPGEQSRPHLPRHVSTALRLGICSSQNNNVNTNAAGLSFPSAAIRPPLYALLPTFVQQQNRLVGQHITLPVQGNQQRARLGAAVPEDMAARRLRETEEQLALVRIEMSHVLHRAQAYTDENQVLRRRISELEQRVTQLTHEEEDAESASTDPNRLEPIMLECKVCVQRRAAVMLWPCRHVCVCQNCEQAARICPVCGQPKDGTFGVILPPT